MKNIFRIFAFIALIGIVFTSCQKDNLLEEEQLKEEVQLFGEPNKVAVIDGQTHQYEMTKTRNTEKGLITGETWIETGTAFQVGNNSEQYQTIKVNRPNGRYFFIMIENLRINPSNNGSWVYDNNNSNVATYGRLYDWQTAENLRLQVYMKLPMIRETTGQIIRPNLTIKGHLPSITDIQDLLETSSIGHLPTNGTDIYGGGLGYEFYYDAFVAGIADAYGDYSAAYHTLSGWRDNLDVAPNNTEFNNINQKAEFWLSNSVNSGTAHYPLSITYNNTPTTYDMVAYVNVACANRYGFAVRYVFEPIYR